MKQNAGRNIRVFLGDDTKRAREALRRALDEEKKENPDAIVTRFDDLSFDRMLLHEALANVSLFGGKNIVVIDGVLDHEAGEEFYAMLPDALKDITNLVLIRETSPAKELCKLFADIGEVREFTLKKATEKTNDFAIANAVAAKDKRSAWVLFAKLKRSGAAMEEVHGRIFWAVKTLYLCKTETRDEATRSGVKEFTYHNYEPWAKRFLLPELKYKLAELKEMYHAAHEGDGDLALSLERFLLKL